MSIRALFPALAFLSLLAVAAPASAQTWSAEQQEIWKFEEQQWQMSKDKDLTWIDKMVHPNLSYWDSDQQSPQNKASLARWNRYNNTNATVLEQELFPISITITGNIAVVHYRYTVGAREREEGARDGPRPVHRRAGQGRRPLAVHRLGRR